MRKITTSQNHTQLKSVSYMNKKGIFVVPRMPRFFDGSNIFFCLFNNGKHLEAILYKKFSRKNPQNYS